MLSFLVSVLVSEVSVQPYVQTLIAYKNICKYRYMTLDVSCIYYFAAHMPKNSEDIFCD